jgi:allantoicase
MHSTESAIQPPAGLVDLASERLGGKVLLANDEFFAEKENLIKPGRGMFIPGKYTDRGKWMDGWETRRRRTPGFDWCIVQLGLAGIIRLVDIDTNHFLGNHPPYASLDALRTYDSVPNDQEQVMELPWTEIAAKAPLQPGSQNLIDIADHSMWTHVKLNIIPDGGVARLRVYGIVVPDRTRFKPGDLVDLAAIENGGVALACSDMFFSSMNNIIMPGRAENMGDGWETKRRRGPGYDWIIVKLGRPGVIEKVEVDTNHFKGNFPDTCSIETCFAPDAKIDQLTGPSIQWREILRKTKLQAHTQHFFENELKPSGTCSHVRLNIFPDGGVSRFRVWGIIE